MKKLIFICGANGIGKTTISKAVLELVSKTAYVDTDPLRYMNPFILDDITIPTIAKNISDLISNYFHCEAIENVVFSYGFHGRRKEVFERVLGNINDIDYEFIPYLLVCDEDENIKRMQLDNRSNDRIKRAVETSRKAYDDIPYQKVDVTRLSAKETAYRIIDDSGLTRC